MDIFVTLPEDHGATEATLKGKCEELLFNLPLLEVQLTHVRLNWCVCGVGVDCFRVVDFTVPGRKDWNSYGTRDMKCV